MRAYTKMYMSYRRLLTTQYIYIYVFIIIFVLFIVWLGLEVLVENEGVFTQKNTVAR